MSSRAELEEERRFLLDSLRDLEREREAGEIAEEDYEALRDDYTARAAEVLRALGDAEETAEADEPQRRDRPSRDRPSRAPSGHSRSRRTLAVALIAGFVLVAVASVFVLAGGREPGEPATGSVPDSAAERLALAHQLESQGQALEALKLYDAVLREDPANVEALTYRGWLLKLAGLADPAQEALDRAVVVDPSYPDAHFFRGMLLFQNRNDPAGAIPEFEKYLALNPPPETVAAVQRVLDQARQAADAAASGATSTTLP